MTRFSIPLLVALGVLVATPARAEDKPVAEALFRAAKDLEAEGKLAEACPKFAESHRLDPKPGTILNLATCHEAEGRTATAWADYAEAATFAERAHQAEREHFARGKVEELEKKLSYVTFHFPAAADFEVLLDGNALAPAAAGTRVPLDPGEHALEARGRTSTTAHWARKVIAPLGPSEIDVEIPALATDSAPPADREPNREAASSSTQRTLGWIALGVGVVGLGVGGMFGMRTLDEKSTVDDHCVGKICDAEGLSANDKALSSATISTIAFVAAGVFGAGGLVLLLTAHPKVPRATAAPARSLDLRAGPGSVAARMMW